MIQYGTYTYMNYYKVRKQPLSGRISLLPIRHPRDSPLKDVLMPRLRSSAATLTTCFDAICCFKWISLTSRPPMERALHTLHIRAYPVPVGIPPLYQVVSRVWCDGTPLNCLFRSVHFETEHIRDIYRHRIIDHRPYRTKSDIPGSGWFGGTAADSTGKLTAEGCRGQAR